MGHLESKQFELRNLMTAPASDDMLVEALLAFGNGQDVVITGQPSAAADMRSWSLRRAAPTPEERAAYKDLLRRLIETPDAIAPGLRDPAGRWHPAFRVIRFPKSARSKAGAPAEILPQDFLSYFGHMSASLELEPILVARFDGYSFDVFRHFKNVASALAFATLLVLDKRNPYGKSLCRCKLPSCERFYLARKNPKGGPPNRTYCDPDHRDEHHNSAERKASARKPKARHK